MSLYETIAARLIGTPLQAPAEWLRHRRGAAERARHPELAEFHREGEWTEQVVRRVIRADTHCIDIGCHIGSFLQRIRTLAPAGRHHAFEPVPHKAAWLRRKFPTVTVHECALADRTGSADFYVNTAQTSYSGLTGRGDTADLAPTRVSLRRLDDEIAADARIGFIKIDVNGAEWRVLQGARELLRRDRPFVLLECTLDGLKDFGVDAADVFGEVTQQNGYRLLLLREFLAGGPALDLAGFRRSMTYPFQTFNYAMVPAAPG